MGILTTAYADSIERLFVITRGHQTLGESIANNPNGSTTWKKNPWFDERPIASFNFDKSFEDLMKVFEYCGFRSVSAKLQVGKFVTPRNDETGFSEGWLLTPATVRTVFTNILKVNSLMLIEKWNSVRAKELKKSGLEIGSFDDLILPDIDSLKNFLAKAAIAEHYLMILQN